MGLIDKLLGTENRLNRAQELYNNGAYQEALEVLSPASETQTILESIFGSRDTYVESFYLTAKCFYELGKYESAIDMLDIIINYPDYNHSYISRAEAFKKRIKNEQQ